MKLEKLSFEETACFSPLFIDYINKKDALKPFYGHFPAPENFEKVIKDRNFPNENRAVLSKVLKEQYGGIAHSEAVDFNIHSLNHEKTFTITTGHQLNIFSGPLYFIYKLVSVIKACQFLKKRYPDYHFVPVYWMASEDHDFEEINHFHLFGKTYQWETDQKGPVGRFKPHSINSVLHQLPETVDLFEKAYLDFSTLAEATRFFVNDLFGDQGLIVLDADHHELKKVFTPVLEKELFENTASSLVEASSQKLNELGYKSQAYVREINLFYIENELRERIIFKDGQYQVLNTDKTFSKESLHQMLLEHPENFSPNVITRPLYQESILPNLAYFGGPAEISYWLQLKSTFDHYNVPFPVLIPRNFSLIINKANVKKLRKLNLNTAQLFKEAQALKTEFLSQVGSNDFNLSNEKKDLAQVFENIKAKAIEVDPSLSGFIGAESAKTFKILDEISKKIKKSEESKNEISLNQIDTLKEKLFPEGGLQERHDNFLNFYLNHPDFIPLLLDKFDPFDFSFNILLDE